MSRFHLTRFGYAAPSCIALVVFLALNLAVSPGSFLIAANLNSLMIGATPFIIMGMAQAAPVMSGGGGLDLSVGPLAGLVNAVVANVLVTTQFTDPLSTIVVVLAIGIASGTLNGVLIAVVRVQPIIVTLATFLAYQGLILQVAPRAGGSAPTWLKGVTAIHFGIPGSVFVIVLISLVWLLLCRSAFRRNLLAVGGDARAAFTAGVDVTFVRIGAYVFAGLLAAVGGLVFTAVIESSDPAIGTPYTLISISAVALGGVSLAGGRGGLLGPAVAGAMLFLIQNLFTVGHISVFYLQIAYGLILLTALIFNSLAGRKLVQ